MPTQIIQNEDTPTDHGLQIHQLTAGDVFRTSQHSSQLFVYRGPKSSLFSKTYVAINISDGTESHFGYYAMAYVYTELQLTFKRI